MEKVLRKAKRVNKSIFNAYFPENFNVENVMSQISGRSHYKNNLKNSVYFILHLIISSKTKDREGFTYLDAICLKRICGNNYIVALNLLEKNGIIEKGKGYGHGLTKRYCLTIGYNQASKSEINLDINSNVNKNIFYEKANKTTD